MSVSQPSLPPSRNVIAFGHTAFKELIRLKEIINIGDIYWPGVLTQNTDSTSKGRVFKDTGRKSLRQFPVPFGRKGAVVSWHQNSQLWENKPVVETTQFVLFRCESPNPLPKKASNKGLQNVCGTMELKDQLIFAWKNTRCLLLEINAWKDIYVFSDWILHTVYVSKKSHSNPQTIFRHIKLKY